MMVDQALQRILNELGAPDLVEDLADLPGADLTSLLLAVMRARVASIAPSDVLQRYAADRFSAPGVIPAAQLDAARELLIEHLPDVFERLTLAPVSPLGTHASLGHINQNNVVSTVRGSEVAADNTAGMALEAALRRRQNRSTVVRLAAVQRITRAQPYESPQTHAHFEVFGLVTAGRDTGHLEFERRATAEHVEYYVSALANTADAVKVVVTDYSGSLSAVVDAVRERIEDRATVEPWPDRQDGAAYYAGLRFTIHAQSGGVAHEVADGGPVNWTERLLSDRKERLMTSGIGLERVAGILHSG